MAVDQFEPGEMRDARIRIAEMSEQVSILERSEVGRGRSRLCNMAHAPDAAA